MSLSICRVPSNQRSLIQWDQSVLRQAILEKLESRFGQLPTFGILSGQAVASACYDVVGLAVGAPMNDLDVFVDHEHIVDCEHSNEFSGAFLASKERTFTFHGCSFGDAIQISTLDKGSYRIRFTANAEYNPEINIIGCEAVKELTAESLLSGFDLNLCEIAIDLNKGSMVWTDAFQEFLFSETIRVSRLITPIHTAIRLIRKSTSMPQFKCDLASELRILKMARRIGQMCETENRNYLASQILSDYTIERHQSEMAVLAEHFDVRKVCIEFQGEPAIEMSTLDAKGLNDEDEALAQLALNSFCWTNCNAGIDAYFRAADLLFNIVNLPVNPFVKQAYEHFIHLISTNHPSVMPNENDFIESDEKSNSYHRFGRLQTVEMVKYLLLRDQSDLLEIDSQDIKNILLLMSSDHFLLNDYFAKNIVMIAAVASNVLYLNRNGLGYISYYIRKKMVHYDYFRELHCHHFVLDLEEKLPSFKEALKRESFEGIAEYFGLISTADVEITALSNRSQFVDVMESESCFCMHLIESCADKECIVLHLRHKKSLAIAVGVYWVRCVSAENDRGFNAEVFLTGFASKGGAKVASELEVLPKSVIVHSDNLPEDIRECFKPKVFTSAGDELDEIPW